MNVDAQIIGVTSNDPADVIGRRTLGGGGCFKGDGYSV